jgi:hypothetical protein
VSAASWKPTQAELLDASARTAAVLADPSAARADVARAAELEEHLYAQLEAGPCDRLTDPGPLHSGIDYSPEMDAEAAEYEAELEAAL